TDSATYSVPTEPGFTYSVTLNNAPVAAGVTNVVSVMDYYELDARRTELSSGLVVTQFVKFIVLSSRRGSPETGLIEWTPYPPIPSGRDEFVGGALIVVAPQKFPAGLEVPVVAWVDDGPGNARRVNGNVMAPGFATSTLPLRRGVGHAFLPAQSSGAAINYDAQIQSLRAAKAIEIDATTTWQTVSGEIPPGASWPDNSRIHVTGNITIAPTNTLTIGAGTVIWLDPSVNITNSGRTVINGTREKPVVFTPSAHVAPEQHTGAWGGFILRGASAELIANGAIMTGSGASTSFSFSPGTSHRSEQALLLIQSGAKAFLTNCFLINHAGQIGNGYNSDVVYDHCLLQRAITGGEYVGGTVTVNNSAVIEFPEVSGKVNAQIADADYDAIYFTTGTHVMKDSLIGFAKDDAIDSGSGGAGTVVVTNCWVESALHEALAWSGGGRQTWTYDSILINSGQGIECGWSTGTDSPLCFAERLLSIGNSIGARYGDNYTGTTGLGLKTGFLTVTNSFLIHNYRDVFGRPWDDTWNYRDARMDIRSNYLTAPNPHHPSNEIWNAAIDAARLAPFMRTPHGAKVGVGFANWTPLTFANLSNGIPVRLSTFTTNFVRVNYAIETPGALLASGTLVFEPGETALRIPAPAAFPTNEVVRVVLREPSGAEITTATQQVIAPAVSAENLPLISLGATWKFLDDGSDQGSAWRTNDFDEGAWRSGAAQLGFGESDETTPLQRIGKSGTTNITFYFRKTFSIVDPSAISELQMRLLRDDAGVVYLNGKEVFRSPNLPAAPAVISYTTPANATGENTIDNATLSASPLRAAENVLAVEIHQESITSSDVSFDFELYAVAPQPLELGLARFGTDHLLYWDDQVARLESTDVLTAQTSWSPVDSGSPYTIPTDGSMRFYRLAQ
ncbi:MAG TPA: hypothetical protein VM680_16310, partial [Verrucomicrobiae bacterium]|nr:hypothetical protein [Verrucomicrobiae bacterium]